MAQKAVIAFSTLLYIILILSYVDPEAFVDIKTEEQGGVRVEARHPRTGVLRLGYLQKYSSSSINSGSVLFDDDVLAASNAALAAAEGKQPVSVIHTLTAQPLLVHEMRVIYPSRGLIMQILGFIFQTVIRRQPLEEYKNTIHIVNLETELTMLSIAREQGLEENRIERVRGPIYHSY